MLLSKLMITKESFKQKFFVLTIFNLSYHSNVQELCRHHDRDCLQSRVPIVSRIRTRSDFRSRRNVIHSFRIFYFFNRLSQKCSFSNFTESQMIRIFDQRCAILIIHLIETVSPFRGTTTATAAKNTRKYSQVLSTTTHEQNKEF